MTLAVQGLMMMMMMYMYAAILTDTWDHLQKGSDDTEMRPDLVTNPI